MRLVLTAAIFLMGLFDLFVGLSFLFDPLVSAAGAGFSVAPINITGLATLRADMTAFFCVSAVCMMVGAWRRNADLLLIPAALFGTAMTVRIVSVAIDGAGPGFQMPIIIEAIHFLLLTAAWRVLPHHRLEELTS